MFSLNSVLGRSIILLSVMAAAHYHVLGGVAVLLVLIYFKSSIFEGMENEDTDMKDGDTDMKDGDSDMADEDSDMADEDTGGSSKQSIAEFKKKHCIDGKLMKDDKEITTEEMKTAFPDLKFLSEDCNPCDIDCNFEIISSNERLTSEENIKAVDSSTISVDREKAIATSD